MLPTLNKSIIIIKCCINNGFWNDIRGNILCGYTDSTGLFCDKLCLGGDSGCNAKIPACESISLAHL